MTVQEFVDQTVTKTFALSDLTKIASDRTAFGDDVLDAFRTQVEHRAATAAAVLDAAANAGRDTLLASEQRSHDSSIRDRDSILSLLRTIEARTDAKGRVPETQIVREERTTDTGPVLTREQRMGDYVARFHPGTERGAMRFGALVRALALGDRRGLSDPEKRALSEGTDSAGGYTVPEIVASQFIDRVRNQMVVMRAGARTVPMTSDVLHIARLAQPGMFVNSSPLGSAANWKTENAAITEANLTLERVSFTARTVAMLIKLSVELSEDSTNIDQIIETEMSKSIALELDRAALLGSGIAPEPLGIKNQPGVTLDTLGTPTNWDFLATAAGALWGDNIEPNAAIYGATFATLAAKLKSSVDSQPLVMPKALDGITQYRSNQAGANVFVGDFTNLMIGIRTSFKLEVSRVAADAASSAFTNMQVWVRAYLRADVQLAHPEAFVVLS